LAGVMVEGTLGMPFQKLHEEFVMNWSW